MTGKTRFILKTGIAINASDITVHLTLDEAKEILNLADKVKEARNTLLRLRHEVGYIRKKDIEDAFAGIAEDEE